MNTRDITIIILLLIVLAVLYKMMQGAKLQTELATGIAKKLGVEIKKPKTRQQIREEEEEVEHEEETEEEETEEEETEEEPEGEVEVETKDRTGKLVVVKAPTFKVKKKTQKRKLKAYEEIASVFTDSPLPSGEIMARYEDEYGDISSNDFWLTLNYSIKKGLIKKYQISESPKKNIYGLPEMFDGEELKEEHKNNLPK
jgi:hypothetical protein